MSHPLVATRLVRDPLEAAKYIQVAKRFDRIGLDVEFRPQDQFISPEWKEILYGEDVEARPKLLLSKEFKKVSFDPYKSELVTLQIGLPLIKEKYWGIVFDVQTIGVKRLADILRPLLESGITCIAHNALTEYVQIKQHMDISISTWIDTMLQNRVLTAGLMTPNNLGAVRHHYLPEYYTLEDAMEEKETTRLSFIYQRETITPVQADYAGRDAADLLIIEPLQRLELEEKNLVQVAGWENDLIPVVGDMELKGVKVDIEAWRDLCTEARTQCQKLYDELQVVFLPAKYLEAMGNIENLNPSLIKTCDPNSWQDMLRAFRGFGYKKIGNVDLSKREDNKDKPSVDSDVLMGYRRALIQALRKAGRSEEKIMQVRKPIDLLLDYRTWSQRLKNFGDAWLDENINNVTGFVHSHFNQYGADSGRFSSSKPNLQQIPSRGDQAERYRHCFIARPGCKLVGCDWPQLELRILAVASGDDVMVDVFNSGRDLHTMSAALFLGMDYDELLGKLATDPTARATRTLAKTVGFGVAYGMGADALSIRTVESDPEGLGKPARCGLTKSDFDEGADPCNDCARCALLKFRRTYPKAVSYLDSLKKITEFTLVSQDLGGGKRFFALPNPDRIRAGFRAEAEKKGVVLTGWDLERRVKEQVRAETAGIQREGANHAIQGTNARMIKIAMRKIWERIQVYSATIVLVIHDEIIVECKEDDAPVIGEIIKEEMINAAQYFLKGVVPVPVEPHISECWSK